MTPAKRKRALSQGKKKKRSKSSYRAPVVKRAVGVTQRVGFGNLQVVKMRYADKFLFPTTTLGATAYQTIAINDVFDPDRTNIGHQPMIHDQVAGIFENYTVTQLKYKISFVNSSIDNTIIVGYYVNDRIDTAVNVTSAIEQGMCEWKHVSVKTGEAIASYEGTIDIPKVMGYSYGEYVANSKFETDFGNSPTDPAFMHIFYCDAASTSVSTAPVLFFDLEFIVRCTGSRLQQPS